MTTYQSSTRVTAGSTAVTTGRARLISVSWVGAAGAGRITLTNGSGGTTLFDIDTPAGAGNSGQVFVCEASGILFPTSLFCSTMSAGFCTVFYET